MKNKISTFFIIVIISFSCGRSELKPSEYISWCDNSENNLVKTYEQGSIVLTCQYTTPEYVALKQSDPANINESEVMENIDGIKDMEHFKLKFENTESNNFLKDNYTSLEEFNTRSMYLSFDIRYDLNLVANGDTSMCVLNHHERTYGNTPFETVLLSFPKTSDQLTDLELIFEDRVFGLGRVKFLFDVNILNDLPKLVF